MTPEEKLKEIKEFAVSFMFPSTGYEYAHSVCAEILAIIDEIGEEEARKRYWKKR